MTKGECIRCGRGYPYELPNYMCPECHAKDYGQYATEVKELYNNMEGKKYDQEKIKWHLLPPELMEGVAQVLMYGAEKYGLRNFEAGMDYSRPFSALMRHMWAWWMGEDNDKETGMSHLWHACSNICFLMTYTNRGTGRDDRPNNLNK